MFGASRGSWSFCFLITKQSAFQEIPFAPNNFAARERIDILHHLGIGIAYLGKVHPDVLDTSARKLLLGLSGSRGVLSCRYAALAFTGSDTEKKRATASAPKTKDLFI